ncbi:MAG: hypothetical protein GY720_14650 [bacterium]|nr:hypothetical protein [bacterium]
MNTLDTITSRRQIRQFTLGHPSNQPLTPIASPTRRDFDDVVYFDTW